MARVSAHHVLLSRDLTCPRDSELVSPADSRATGETSSRFPQSGCGCRELSRRFESSGPASKRLLGYRATLLAIVDVGLPSTVFTGRDTW